MLSRTRTAKSGFFYKSMALLPCGMAVMAEVGSMFETIEKDKAQQEALALLLQKVEGFKPFIASNFQFEDLVFMFTCFRCRIICSHAFGVVSLSVIDRTF